METANYNGTDGPSVGAGATMGLPFEPGEGQVRRGPVGLRARPGIRLFLSLYFLLEKVYFKSLNFRKSLIFIPEL